MSLIDLFLAQISTQQQSGILEEEATGTEDGCRDMMRRLKMQEGIEEQKDKDFIKWWKGGSFLS